MADTSELTLATAPTSKRFPTTNQAKACYMYYNSWHQCKYDYSDEEPQCAKLKGWAMSMCPIEWVRVPPRRTRFPELSLWQPPLRGRQCPSPLCTAACFAAGVRAAARDEAACKELPGLLPCASAAAKLCARPSPRAWPVSGRAGLTCTSASLLLWLSPADTRRLCALACVRRWRIGRSSASRARTPARCRARKRAATTTRRAARTRHAPCLLLYE